jgi:hypothetical protein
MGLVDDNVLGVGSVAAEAGAAVAGAEVVAEEPELSLGGMSQTLGWPDGQKICGDKSDQPPAESTGHRRRYGTLRSE